MKSVEKPCDYVCELPWLIELILFKLLEVPLGLEFKHIISKDFKCFYRFQLVL